MSAGPRTAYARGANFEREVKRVFEADGFVVTRSPKSGGVYDLHATRGALLVLLIQCKKHGECRPEEWNRLFELARVHGAIPIIAARKARGKLQLWRLTGPKVTRGPQPWEEWPIFPGNREGDDGTKGEAERAD